MIFWWLDWDNGSLQGTPWRWSVTPITLWQVHILPTWLVIVDINSATCPRQCLSCFSTIKLLLPPFPLWKEVSIWQNFLNWGFSKRTFLPIFHRRRHISISHAFTHPLIPSSIHSFNKHLSGVHCEYDPTIGPDYRVQNKADQVLSSGNLQFCGKADT